MKKYVGPTIFIATFVTLIITMVNVHVEAQGEQMKCAAVHKTYLFGNCTSLGAR